MSPISIPDFTDFRLQDNGLSLQAQLYNYCLERIRTGAWVPGARLPATRRCADTLSMSRNTVTAAFTQLVAEGFLEPRQGSGYYVHRDLPANAIDPASGAARHAQALPLPRVSKYGRSLQQQPRPRLHPYFPFTPGIPDLKAFPRQIWSRIDRRNHQRSRLFGFEDFQGHRELRSAIASYLRSSRQVHCEAENILITQGAQQAITLCAQVLLDANDTVLIEDPGYSRARQAFIAQQVQLEAVAAHESNSMVALLPEASNARLLYTTPTHQYPLGRIMPAAERMKLLDWAVHNQTWIIEDDYDSEFHFYDKPVAALQGMAPQTPVIYMGSFSKTLFPALRLGFLVLPDELIGAFTTAKGHADGESPLIAQATTAEFIQEGHFLRHVRRMRVLYRRKWEHFSALLEQHLDGLCNIIAESAGMHLVLENNVIDDVTVARALEQAGFGGSALSTYYADKPLRRGLVLGFANSTEQQREQGVIYLQGLLEEAERQARR